MGRLEYPEDLRPRLLDGGGVTRLAARHDTDGVLGAAVGLIETIGLVDAERRPSLQQRESLCRTLAVGGACREVGNRIGQRGTLDTVRPFGRNDVSARTRGGSDNRRAHTARNGQHDRR